MDEYLERKLTTHLDFKNQNYFLLYRRMARSILGDIEMANLLTMFPQVIGHGLNISKM